MRSKDCVTIISSSWEGRGSNVLMIQWSFYFYLNQMVYEANRYNQKFTNDLLLKEYGI